MSDSNDKSTDQVRPQPSEINVVKMTEEYVDAAIERLMRSTDPYFRRGGLFWPEETPPKR